MNKKLETILKLLFGLGLIAYLFYKIGAGTIVETLLTTKPVSLLIATCLYIISVLMATINYYVLLRPISTISFKELLKPYLKSWILTFIAPGKLGEVSIAYFLRHKIAVGESTAMFIVDKMIMMTIIIILAIAGIFRFFGIDGRTQAIQLSIFLAASFLAVILVVALKKPREIFKRFIPSKYRNMFSGFSKTFKTYRHHKKAVLQNFIIALAKQIIWTLAFYYLINSYGQSVGILDVMLIYAIVSIAGIIPITMGGLGVKEGTAVVLFGMIGVGSAAILSAHIILNVVSVILAIITYFAVAR